MVAADQKKGPCLVRIITMIDVLYFYPAISSQLLRLCDCRGTKTRESSRLSRSLFPPPFLSIKEETSLCE